MWQHFITGFYQSLTSFDYIIECINIKLLYYTSHLFLLPIIYYSIAIKQTILLSVLFSMVFINFLLSIVFWSLPIKGSMVHYIDSILAKITIFLMIITTTIRRILVKRPLLWFYICLFLMVIFFYLSNLYSTIEWCSKEHLITHAMGHVMATISMFFVFFS